MALPIPFMSSHSFMRRCGRRRIPRWTICGSVMCMRPKFRNRAGESIRMKFPDEVARPVWNFQSVSRAQGKRLIYAGSESSAFEISLPREPNYHDRIIPLVIIPVLRWFCSRNQRIRIRWCKVLRMLRAAFAVSSLAIAQRWGGGLFPRLVQRQTANTIDAARRNDEPRKLTASARHDAAIVSANASEGRNIACCCSSSPPCRRSTTIVPRREIGISARQRTHRRESLTAGISETPCLVSRSTSTVSPVRCMRSRSIGRCSD